MNDDSCRLCGGATRQTITRLILKRHRAKYFTCLDCGSQQTELPTWLGEAYSLPGLHIDVGAPTRTVKNWIAATILLERINLPTDAKCLDFGAGSGLFTGLMRSSGRDFLSYDALQSAHFSSDYVVEGLGAIKPEVITAFEVFEHLPKPGATLAELFSQGAKLIIFTTWFIDEQDDAWVYYIPDSGQHVFFFKEAAIANYAATFGYEMVGSQYFYILYSPHLMSQAAREAIQHFARHSKVVLSGQIQSVIESVIDGNQHLDRDFVQANHRLAHRLENTRLSRTARFGFSHHMMRAISRFWKRVYLVPVRSLRKLLRSK